MTIPIGIRRQIDRVENNLRKLHTKLTQELLNQTSSDVDLELHSHCRALSDCCDQVANAIWSWLPRATTTPKPNVYWPTSASKDKFNKLLSKQQMDDLECLAPQVYHRICSTQSWCNPNSTIPVLKQLASVRHQENLAVDVGINQSMTIGHGESVYIEKLEIFNGQILELKGSESTAGVTRPISIQHHLDAHATEQRTRRELFGLLYDACAEIKSCCAEVYREIS